MTSFEPAPHISLSRPVRGRRERICEGEEASVSRMLGPKKYAGMVERLQEHSPLSYDMPFDLAISRDSGDQPSRISAGNPASHILRFLALRFARTIYPESFVDVRELRLSRNGDSLVSAMYSDFVPDDGGVIGRRAGFLRRFHSADDPAERQWIRFDADEAERETNPALAREMKLMELSGIIVPHPEANYHLSGGKTVFFEVLGIDVRRAYAVVSELSQSPEEPLALLSMMCSVLFNAFTKLNPNYFVPFVSLFPGIGFGEVSSAVYGILSKQEPLYPDGGRPDTHELFNEIHSSLHYVYSRADTVRALEVPSRAMPMPVAIDPSLVRPGVIPSL